jgi:peptidoglycan hydrolase-like protein with peptidoglycan-binding domain
MRGMKSAFLLLVFVAAAALPRPAASGIAFWDEAVRDRPTIAAVQVALRSEGYDPGASEGKLTPKTVRALKQAQAQRELEPTGRPDRRTVAALGIAVEESASAGASLDRKEPRQTR